MTTGPYTDIEFVLSGSEGRGDFIGISGSALDKADIGVFTCESGSVNFLSKSAGTMLNVYNGPYQYPSWQQTRNLYNPVVRKLVENSILSVAKIPPVRESSDGNQIRAIREGVFCFKEPVVSQNSKPLVHVVAVQPNINDPTVTTSSFTYTYNNNLESFTDVNLRNLLGTYTSDAQSMYKNISQLYLDLEQVDANTNPVRDFVRLNYSQVLYPAPMNAFLNRTRTRTNYGEIAGKGSNGYDRIFGHQRTFFKENQIRTNGVALNSQGYIPSLVSGALNFTSSFSSDGFFPAANFWRDGSSGLVETPDPPTYFINEQGRYTFVFGHVPSEDPYEQIGTAVAVTDRYIQLQKTVKNNPTIDAIEFSFQVCRGPGYGAPHMGTPDSDHPLLVQYKTSTGSWTNFPTDGGGTAGGVILPASLTLLTYTDWTASLDLATEAPGEVALVRIGMEGPFSVSEFYENNYAIQGLKLAVELSAPSPDALNFNPMATDGIRSFPYTSSYRDYDGELMADTDESMFGSDPIPSLAFTEQLYLANESGSFAVYSDYLERLTEQIAGRNPWYNNYEQYDLDVRPKDKDMSILPEFRISDFISYYLIDQGANFRAKNNQFLSLTGGPITSSAYTENSPFNTDFGVKYVESSNSSRLKAITQEHGDIADVTRIELSCKGLKKLLPYNGFYPANRTIQLGNLLSQSMSPYISGSYEGSTLPYPAQGLQALLKPLMSPGILYNTIKSGIAVDYPIYTGTVPGFTLGTDAPADFILTSAPNYRLPFESLLNLKGALPEGPENPIRLVSSFATFDQSLDTSDLFKYYFTWNGDKSPLFELGMHNFLAETVDFFLEGSELTSYRSQPQPEEGWYFEQQAESGDPIDYYMDVVLRDTVEMSKFAEYFSRRNMLRESTLIPTDPQADADFGYSVALLSGGVGDGFWALVGSPKADLGGLTFMGQDYYNGAAYLFQNKMDTQGWVQKHKFSLPPSIEVGTTYKESPRYGAAVAMISQSNCLICAIAAPNAGRDIEYPMYNDGGRVVFSRYFDGEGVIQTVVSASIMGPGSGFGTSIDLAQGTSDSLNDIWMIVGAPGDYFGGMTQGSAWIFNYRNDISTTWHLSSSVQMVTAADFGTSSVQGAGVGSSVAIDVSDQGVYSVVGVPNGAMDPNPPDTEIVRGWVGLLHSNSAGQRSQMITSSYLPSPIVPPDAEFGGAVDIVSGTEGVYILVGATEFDDTSSGAGFLFHSKSSDPGDPNAFGLSGSSPMVSVLSGGVSIPYRLGKSVSLFSSSENGVCGLVGSEGVSTLLPGGALLFQSNSLGTDHFLIDYQTVTPPTTEKSFGWDVSLLSGSGKVYALVGAPNASGSQVGSGIGHFYTGTVNNMSTFLPYLGLDYDYKQHGKLFGLPLDSAYDPAYCAYTPPYFYGDAAVRIKFSPTLEAPYTLDEIFAQSTVVNLLTVDDDRVAVIDGEHQELLPVQNSHKMPLTSSVNLFGRYFQPGVSYDATTGEGETTTQNSSDQPVWVISTKFECPVLDVSSSKYDELYTAHNDYITGTYSFTPGANIEYNKPRSMWTSYGQTPKEKGVYLELRESFPHLLNSNSPNIGSLLQKCGFQSTVDSKIGKVAQTKEISETIVAIPYFENTIVQKRRSVTGDTEEVVDEDLTIDLKDGGIAGKHFVKIHPVVYESTLTNMEQSNVAVTADFNSGREIKNTTISNMIKRMKKYVLPPNLDFVKYNDIPPFVMYLFEFNHTLQQKELSDIWQGIMPDSAFRMENDEVIISHQFGPFDFYGNMADRRLLGEMKFLVFKVKKRAKYNYYQTTKDSTDDSRFDFSFQGNPVTNAINVGGSYNWPYDFFSLVEKAKIETKLVMRKKLPPAPPPTPEENETEE